MTARRALISTRGPLDRNPTTGDVPPSFTVLGSKFVFKCKGDMGLQIEDPSSFS